MSFITAMSSLTCHGENLWAGLNQKPTPPTQHERLGPFPAYKLPLFRDQLFDIQILENSVLENIAATLRPLSTKEHQKNWGFILASTKGTIEDFIWTEDISNNYRDPFHLFLTKISGQLPLNIKKQITVSNACASSHSALALAQRWLDSQQVDHVLVLAFDIIGPFIQKGFSALQALSPSHEVRPFASDRDGLLLGDGIASCVLSREATEKCFSLSPVSVIGEGFSVTRPQTEGQALYRALKKTSENRSFEGIIAHGTGTPFNDKTEDKAFSKIIDNPTNFITANKWSVGHTLGASGLIDIIAGCLMIEHQEVTGIPTHQESDLSMKEFFTRKTSKKEIHNILVSSLGFGGVNAAVVVGKSHAL